MIRIPITELIKVQALTAEKEILDSLRRQGRLDRQSYTKLEEPRRYYFGYLGQYAMASHLKKMGKRFENMVRTDGESDEGDFLLHMKLGDRTADIKTNSKSYPENYLLVAKKEVSTRGHFNFYIGSRLAGEFVEVFGFCYFDEFLFSEDKFKIPDYYIKFEELRDIENLINRIENIGT